jgi:hypothetical protein
MLLDLKSFLYICSVEVATVYLQSQVRNYKPVWGSLATRDPNGFSYLTRSVAKGPGRGQTWNLHSLDQVNGVLGNRKPHGSNLIFMDFSFLSSFTFFSDLFFSFFLFFKKYSYEYR